jgi:hypothetical protein
MVNPKSFLTSGPSPTQVSCSIHPNTWGQGKENRISRRCKGFCGFLVSRFSTLPLVHHSSLSGFALGLLGWLILTQAAEQPSAFP